MIGQGFRRIFILLFVLALIPSVAGFLVLSYIQKRLNIEIEGTYIPSLISPVFYLRNAKFEWDDRVKLWSGTLKVEYSPAALLSAKTMRVKLSSQNVDIELLGNWAKMENVGRVTLDEFYADVGIGQEGINQIYTVEVLSPQFQFYIGSSGSRPRKIQSMSKGEQK